MIRELDTVVLTREVAGYPLKAGDVGAVVHAYEDGTTFEVEFVTGGGKTLAVVTLTAADLRPLQAEEILHARALASA